MEILDRLRQLGVGVETVGVDALLPTGTVAVELSDDGQPKFIIQPDVAWDAIEAAEPYMRAAEQCDALCFGTLAMRSEASRGAILSIVDHMPRSALRVLDINMRPPFVEPEIISQALARADVLKLNDQELPVLADMLGLRGRSVDARLIDLASRFSLRLIALTRGAAGSILFPAEGYPSEHPGLPVEVVDAVGAGDSFTAAMVLGYLRGWDLDQINERANRVAAFVCSQHGATPPLPPNLVSLWAEDPDVTST
jgi:fructokinase